MILISSLVVSLQHGLQHEHIKNIFLVSTSHFNLKCYELFDFSNNINVAFVTWKVQSGPVMVEKSDIIYSAVSLSERTYYRKISVRLYITRGK